VHDERGVVGEHVDRAPVAVARQDRLVGALTERALVAPAQQRERVLHVVRLVEDDGVRSGQIAEAEQTAEDRDAERDEPRRAAIGRHRGSETLDDGRGAVAGPGRGRCRPVLEGRRHPHSIRTWHADDRG